MVAAFHLARIFGPFLLILGLWCLFYRHKAFEAAKGVASSPTHMLIFSIINLLVGLTIVNMFNHWVWDLTLLVTLLGWFLIVRGVFGLYWPNVISRSFFGSEKCLTIWGVIWVVWGFFLTWLGYFCEMGRHSMG